MLGNIVLARRNWDPQMVVCTIDTFDTFSYRICPKSRGKYSMKTGRQFAGAIGRAASKLAEDDPDRITLDELRSLLASQLVTTGDATELLDIGSKNTVKRLLEAGKIEGAVKTSGGHWRIPPSALLAYRAEQIRLRESGSLRPARARRRSLALAGVTSTD
jgi:excisionase family DNA binding protein